MAEADGYLQVLVANESDRPVWFDDVSYQIEPTMITQETHYDPWGLELAGIERWGSPEDEYKFQDKELLTALALYQYDFGARYYDPQLGRWHTPDPADQFASPYAGMGNNPVMGVDPDGRWVHILVGAVIGGVVNLGVKAFQGKITSVGDGFAAFGIGAVGGALTAATGGAFAASAGLSVSTVAGGAVAGSVGAAFGGPVQGIGNAAYFGDAYGPGQFLTDVLVGGVVGGVAGWIKNAKSARVGGPKIDPWGFRFGKPGGTGGLGEGQFAEFPSGNVRDASGKLINTANDGIEYLDEGLRMTEQPFADITSKTLPELQTIAKQNSELFRQLFGTNEKGAKAILDNIKNVKIPEGLSREAMQAYRELINRVGDPRGTQAIRAEILDKLLKR